MNFDIANHYFTYDPFTGAIFRVKPSGRLGDHSYFRKNKRADRKRGDGYRVINFTHDGVCMRTSAHRMAWLLYHGKLPVHGIDHINGDPGDNRLCNLRDVTQSVNMLNRHVKWGKDKTLPIGVTQKTRIRKDRGGRSFTYYYVVLCKDGVKRWASRRDRSEAILLRKKWELQCA
jgi:hypothetical protein